MIHRIDGNHPLSLDTLVFDRNNNEIYTKYIDVYYQEIIKAKICINPEVRDSRYTEWVILHREKEEDLGLDYYIHGMKNPDVNKLMKWLIYNE